MAGRRRAEARAAEFVSRRCNTSELEHVVACLHTTRRPHRRRRYCQKYTLVLGGIELSGRYSIGLGVLP